MRTIILFAILLSAVCLSCSNKRQRFQPEATPDKESAIIGRSDKVTSIQVVSGDKDTSSMIRRSVAFGMSKICLISTRTNLFPCGRNVLFIGRMYKSLMCSLQTRHQPR